MIEGTVLLLIISLNIAKRSVVTLLQGKPEAPQSIPIPITPWLSGVLGV